MTAQSSGGAVADAIIAFLRRHPPFDHMENDALAALAATCRVVYFAQDEIIVSPAAGVAGTFNVINRGGVAIEQSASNVSVAARNIVIGPGECFLISALIGTRATGSAACATR